MTEDIFEIYLVRHARSVGNVDMKTHAHVADHAIDLDPSGHDAAVTAGIELGKHLCALPTFAKDPRFRIWVSPYKRTRETTDGLEVGLKESLANTPALWDRREQVTLVE